MDTTEFEQEKKYLDTVLSVIERQLLHFTEKESGDIDNLLQARKDMWDNAPHLIQSTEDAIELVAQNLIVSNATDQYIMTTAEISKLKKMQKSPYFGRFDFIESSELGQEAIYIGANNLMNDENYDIYVYDWRAPICSAFYEYDLGTHLMRRPMGSSASKSF